MSEKRNLLDMMTPEHREIAQKAYEERMAGGMEYRRDKVPPITYMVAEAGMYFGWGAIEAIKRGYIEAEEERGNQIVKTHIPFSTIELAELCRAARKINFSDIVNRSRGTHVAAGAALAKNPNKAFESGMKPFIKEAKI